MNASWLRHANASAAALCSGNRAAAVVAVRVELLGQDRLGQRPQREAVIGRDRVDRSSLDDEAHDPAVQDQRLELGGLEVLQT